VEKEELEIKRKELVTLVDNFCLSSETVVKMAREFEEMANKVYDIRDGAYWMNRAKKLENLLNEVQVHCPEKHKTEIEKVLRV
jgi:hypothetical protein